MGTDRWTGTPDAPVLADLADDGVLTLTLNRPARRNGWTPEIEHRFFALLDEAERDSAVRVLVVTGAGRTFCPGADSGRMDATAGKALDLSDRRPFHRPLTMRKPTVAAINGACAGVGLLLALMSDIRFADRGARFATSFARRGLPAERGLSWLLPRITGLETALDLLLSGRTFDAAEAQRLRVVSRLSEPGEALADAQEYAAMLAEQSSPLAMGVIREQIYNDLDGEYTASYERAMTALDRMVGGSEFREGVDSFLEKRSPRFAPLPEGFDPARYLER